MSNLGWVFEFKECKTGGREGLGGMSKPLI